jgi:hypothetical protein
MRLLTLIGCFLAANLIHAPGAYASPQPERVLEVIDGGTLKAEAVDENGKPKGESAIGGIRGMEAPALDQPFGKQAHDRLKELVDGKQVGSSIGMKLPSEPNSHPQENQTDPTGPATGVGRDHSADRGGDLGFRVALAQTSTEAAEESGAAAEKPAGGRVAYMLLVNGAVTDAVVKSANIEGHKSVDAPFVGTWHSFVKGMDQIQKGRLDPLARGEIDVMLIGTLKSYPDAEAWKNHLGPDDSTLAGLAALGAKENPKFRICWQTYIWPVGQTPKDGKKTLDVAATKKRAASEPLNQLEKLVDAINERHGRKVVLISPVGDATIKLVEMVAAGKFPGITDPADLWTEFNMHSNRHVLALTAYCNVATMYGVSPVGLKPDFSKVTYGGGGKGPGIQSMEGITDEQQAILQNIAGETVSKYRHAGIAK